jgi:hypothetical protein
MPSGHKAFLVHNEKDVDLLLMHNRTYAAEYVDHYSPFLLHHWLITSLGFSIMESTSGLIRDISSLESDMPCRRGNELRSLLRQRLWESR